MILLKSDEIGIFEKEWHPIFVGFVNTSSIETNHILKIFNVGISIEISSITFIKFTIVIFLIYLIHILTGITPMVLSVDLSSDLLQQACISTSVCIVKKQVRFPPPTLSLSHIQPSSKQPIQSRWSSPLSPPLSRKLSRVVGCCRGQIYCLLIGAGNFVRSGSLHTQWDWFVIHHGPMHYAGAIQQLSQ